MDAKEFIKRLWYWGHFWNPKYPEVLNVREVDLANLSLTDFEVELAVKSFQESDANLAPLSLSIHGRTAVEDGHVGPATIALAELERCPVPDHVPPPGVRSLDPDLDAVIRSMQDAAAIGSGSWPAGCHGTPGVHEVKISYDLSKLTAKHKEWWPEIKTRSHAAVAAVGIKLTEVPVGSSANITLYGKSLGGSTIGMAQFNSGRCSDVVFCQLNPNYAPEIDMVLNLLLHENGHNWNLQHKSGNIMNPSILRTPTYWVKRENGVITYQDNSYPTLKKFFGGEQVGPVTPSPNPNPVPDPPPLPLPIGGVISIDLAAKRVTYPSGWTGGSL